MKRQPFNPNLVTPSSTKAPARQSTPITVSELTARIKRAIATTLPSTIHVIGQISNFKRHSSGHLYFTLKDESSELSCVMWRSDAARLKFDIHDGLEVVATGHVEVFDKAGRYQLYARKLQPEGLGELELAFRQLYNKLSKEGLFDPGHKQPLPLFPKRIVIVTSPTGAAVGDIIRTLQRRFPSVGILVYPVRVQGESASKEIAGAIARVNANAELLGGVDLMIVGRGGGSTEDLWAFNEENVARAIFTSRIPIISAVGHEVDISIADLVADLRAATPTAAAELAVPVLDEILAGLAMHESRLFRSVRQITALATSQLDGLAHHHCFREPLNLVYQREQILDELCGRQHQRLTQQIRLQRQRVEKNEPTIQRIHPHAAIRNNENRLHRVMHRLAHITSMQCQQHDRRLYQLMLRLRQQALDIKLSHSDQLVSQSHILLSASLRRHMATLREHLWQQQQLLTALSHKRVLQRGYSITRLKKGQQILRSVKQLQDTQRIVTELADGEVESEVVNLSQLELFE